MRPVNKGDGSAYKKLIPEIFNFDKVGINKKNAYKSCVEEGYLEEIPNQPYNSFVDVCLNFWLTVVKDNLQGKSVKDRTELDKNRLIVKQMIFDKVQNVYKQAGNYMVQSIGDFCCYCDTPIPGLLEVEHRCSKSQYPLFSMDWDNFLISCGPCNTAKGDRPNRKEFPEYCLDEGEDFFREAIKNSFVWADLDANPYDYIIPALYYFDPDTKDWREVNESYAFNISNIITSYNLPERTVTADLYSENMECQPDVQVYVFMQSMQKNMEYSASNIVDLCKLNDLGSKGTTYDRRLMNRTKAWFTVLDSLKPFLFINPNELSQDAFNLFWHILLITAASTGFFSVWYTILCRFFDPSNKNLGERFARESIALFPGTNTEIIGGYT